MILLKDLVKFFKKKEKEGKYFGYFYVAIACWMYQSSFVILHISSTQDPNQALVVCVSWCCIGIRKSTDPVFCGSTNFTEYFLAKQTAEIWNTRVY